MIAVIKLTMYYYNMLKLIISNLTYLNLKIMVNLSFSRGQLRCVIIGFFSSESSYYVSCNIRTATTYYKMR